MDASHVVIALLIGHGLLVAREDYRVALTAKGREMYALLPLAMEQKIIVRAAGLTARKKASVSPSTRRKFLAWRGPSDTRAP